MKKIAAHTLGCKVNQYDTQAMLELFRKAGYTIVPMSGDADVYLINTCPPQLLMPCICIGYEQEVPNAKRDTRLLPGGVVVIISQKTPFGGMG